MVKFEIKLDEHILQFRMFTHDRKDCMTEIDRDIISEQHLLDTIDDTYMVFKQQVADFLLKEIR